MIRFGIKAGLVAGAAYYQHEQGVWKTSEDSVKCYERFQVAASPYVNEAKAFIPITIPALPNSNRISYVLKESWNSGVGSTFKFVSNVPTCTANYIANQDFGKLFDKLVTPTPVEVDKK